MKRATLALSLCFVTTSAFGQTHKPTWWDRLRQPQTQVQTPTTTQPVKPLPPLPPALRGKFVDVTVVEVAGGQAYVQPGTQKGVRRNAKVVINGKEYRVLQASDSYAVIGLQGAEGVHEKDKGRATIVEDEEIKPQLAPPRPLAMWEHGWTEEQPPAELQEPKFVPLGEARRDRRWDARLSLMMGGTTPFPGQAGSNIFYMEVGARVHAEPFSVPAAFDFDGSLRLWAAQDLSARVGGDTRSVIYVRQLMASYGSTSSWYAGLGRMPYAATTLGTLDGVRVQAPLGGGFTLAAFGGFLPNPLGGEFAVDSQRFGIEARFNRPDITLRPEAALVINGSMFDGKPDERRASAMFGIYPGHSRIGGHIEVANFDPDNPWKANPVEITGAGLDQSFRIGKFEIGGRVDLLEPERSNYLESFLPSSWFCRTVPTPGVLPANEPCDGESQMRALGSLNMGLVLGNVSLALGATAMGDITHGTEPRVIGGWASARVVRIAKYLRLEASANASNATYVNMFGGTAGFGFTAIRDALDVSLYYRRSELEYSTFSTFLDQNGVGGTIIVFPTKTTMFMLQGEGIAGNDVNALTVLGMIAWRPHF